MCIFKLCRGLRLALVMALLSPLASGCVHYRVQKECDRQSNWKAMGLVKAMPVQLDPAKIVPSAVSLWSALTKDREDNAPGSVASADQKALDLAVVMAQEQAFAQSLGKGSICVAHCLAAFSYGTGVSAGISFPSNKNDLTFSGGLALQGVFSTWLNTDNSYLFHLVLQLGLGEGTIFESGSKYSFTAVNPAVLIEFGDQTFMGGAGPEFVCPVTYVPMAKGEPRCSPGLALAGVFNTPF